MDSSRSANVPLDIGLAREVPRGRAFSLHPSTINMASILPPIPRFVFTVFEPIALVAGYLSPMLDPTGFVNSQLPTTSATTISLTATNRILALQLGNLYGLLFMIGVGVLYTTTEAKVVRNYLLACAIADVGHLYATYAVMYVLPASISP